MFHPGSLQSELLNHLVSVWKCELMSDIVLFLLFLLLFITILKIKHYLCVTKKNVSPRLIGLTYILLTSESIHKSYLLSPTLTNRFFLSYKSEIEFKIPIELYIFYAFSSFVSKIR